VHQRSSTAIHKARTRQCLYSIRLLIISRLVILHTSGLEDIAIVLAQILSFGVTVTSLIQVGLGGLGRHIETVSNDQMLIATRVRRAADMDIYDGPLTWRRLCTLTHWSTMPLKS